MPVAVEWTPGYDSADGGEIQHTTLNGLRLVVWCEDSKWAWAIHLPSGVESWPVADEATAKREAVEAALHR